MLGKSAGVGSVSRNAFLGEKAGLAVGGSRCSVRRSPVAASAKVSHFGGGGAEINLI